MAAKFFKTAPVVWGAKTLENIGKPDYSGITDAYRSTSYLGKKVVQK